MEDNNSKKLKLLYVYEILKEYSDEEHPLTGGEICRLLGEKYSVSAERKSVYRDIACLVSAGHNIVTLPRSGYFLAERMFEPVEIRILEDAVNAARFITPKRSAEITEKLRSELSVYQKEELSVTYYGMGIKSSNEHFIYSIDTIAQAISLGVRVRFDYFRMTIKDGALSREYARSHEISPYALIWDSDRYYLVGNYDKYGDLSHYRIDRIESVQLTDKPSRPFEHVCSYRGTFDSADYASKTFGMYSGEVRVTELECNGALLEKVADRFGTDARYVKLKDGRFRVKSSCIISEGLVGWIMTLGGGCRVLAPLSLREAVRSRAIEVMQAQK